MITTPRIHDNHAQNKDYHGRGDEEHREAGAVSRVTGQNAGHEHKEYLKLRDQTKHKFLKSDVRLELNVRHDHEDAEPETKEELHKAARLQDR